MVDVVVLGAVNLDTIYLLPAFPQPGETMLGEAKVADGGKGANQASLLARLGVEVALIGAVGGDPAGGHLVQSLRDAGVDVSAVCEVSGRVSGQGCVWNVEGGSRELSLLLGQIWRCRQTMSSDIVMQLLMPRCSSLSSKCRSRL